MTQAQTIKIYALMRDGEFHSGYATRRAADVWRRQFSPGSKHKWAVKRGQLRLDGELKEGS